MRREAGLDLACWGLLGLVVAAFFWPLLLAGQWIPRGGGDLVSFLWPVYRFAARNLRAGIVPLWNPHLYAGAPFVADNQSGIFYPVNLLAFGLFGEPSYGVMEGLAVFHMWLAGVCMYALARGLGLGRPAGLVGGIAFALSDLFVTHIGNLNLNATVAWLPLLLLLTHRALTRRGPTPGKVWAQGAGSAAGAGVVLAVAALAGHGQMLLFLALTLALYVAYRLAADWRRGLRHAGRSVMLAGLIVGVGLGGAALMLLPALEMAPHTGRGHLSFDEATRYSLPAQALIGLLVPGFFGRGPSGFWGPWDRVEVGYAGIATLVLAVIGVVFAARRSVGGRGTQVETSDQQIVRSQSTAFPAGFFALLVPLAFLLAMGQQTPLYGLLYRYLPAFDQVRAPARLVLLADLGLAALAAYGIDRLAVEASATRSRSKVGLPVEEMRHRPATAWAALGTLVAAVLLAVVGLPQARALPPPDRAGPAAASLIAAVTLLAASGLLVWLAGRQRWAVWLLPVLLAGDLIGLGSTLEAELRDPTTGFSHEDVVAFLRRDTGFYRIEGDAGAWQPDAALVHGLYDVGGIYNPLGLAPYQAFRWAVGERGGPLYNLLGVKYVLADKGAPPGDERLVPVFSGNPEIDVYLNTLALPRAWLVERAQVVADHASAWEAIHAEGFDPRETVVLEQGDVQADHPRSQGAETARDAHIAFAAYGPNEVALVVRTPVPAYLMLSDVYYPGWRAKVDGAPTEVLRADYAFRAVVLLPGEHEIVMKFAPWTWAVGLGISVATWGSLAVWGALALGRHPDGRWRPDGLSKSARLRKPRGSRLD